MTIDDTLPDWTLGAVDLAQPRLGSRIAGSSDDFFASHDRLIAPAPPVFKPGVYDDNGKWMDGWESRRKRGRGHDHCVVQLGRPGTLRGVEIDTRHFTGNYPRAASIDACILEPGAPLETAQWTELVAPQALSGDTRHFFRTAAGAAAFTHVRLQIYPDGGVARLRLWGDIIVDWAAADRDALVDLAALENGGRAIAASDAHFGALANLIAPGRGADMGDGWETRRRREPGFDWGIIRLARAGRLRHLEIDTAHFKGNFAFKTVVYAARLGALPDLTLPALSIYWPVLLPATELSADHIHRFESELEDIGPVDHLRIDMIPDGGISRLRAWGTAEPDEEG